MTTKTINGNYYAGSKECSKENIDFFRTKLQDLVNNNTKMTFRQWTNKIIQLLDIIN